VLNNLIFVVNEVEETTERGKLAK